jgi:hypothetical protein
MATKKLRIELTVAAVDSDERMRAITEALRRAGRQLHAEAMLICGDGAPPKVELSGEDLVDGTHDIPMQEDADDR